MNDRTTSRHARRTAGPWPADHPDRPPANPGRRDDPDGVIASRLTITKCNGPAGRRLSTEKQNEGLPVGNETFHWLPLPLPIVRFRPVLESTPLRIWS